MAALPTFFLGGLTGYAGAAFTWGFVATLFYRDAPLHAPLVGLLWIFGAFFMLPVAVPIYGALALALARLPRHAQLAFWAVVLGFAALFAVVPMWMGGMPVVSQPLWRAVDPKHGALLHLPGMIGSVAVGVFVRVRGRAATSSGPPSPPPHH